MEGWKSWVKAELQSETNFRGLAFFAPQDEQHINCDLYYFLLVCHF